MSNEMRDWADIRLFLAIFENGSLVAAGEQLDLTQPNEIERVSVVGHPIGGIDIDLEVSRFDALQVDHLREIRFGAGRFIEVLSGEPC